MTVKVTMNLSDLSVQNAERIMRILNTRTKTQAVESALSLAALVLEKMSLGADIVVEEKSGKRTNICIPGIENRKEVESHAAVTPIPIAKRLERA